jgi:hypothetical protein
LKYYKFGRRKHAIKHIIVCRKNIITIGNIIITCGNNIITDENVIITFGNNIRFLRPRSTSPVKGANPAGPPGYRNGTESFFGLKGHPSVVRDV